MTLNLKERRKIDYLKLFEKPEWHENYLKTGALKTKF